MRELSMEWGMAWRMYAALSLASMGLRFRKAKTEGGNSLLLSRAAALHHFGQLVDHRFKLVGLGGQLSRGGG